MTFFFHFPHVCRDWWRSPSKPQANLGAGNCAVSWLCHCYFNCRNSTDSFIWAEGWSSCYLKPHSVLSVVIMKSWKWAEAATRPGRLAPVRTYHLQVLLASCSLGTGDSLFKETDWNHGRLPAAQAGPRSSGPKNEAVVISNLTHSLFSHHCELN